MVVDAVKLISDANLKLLPHNVIHCTVKIIRLNFGFGRRGELAPHCTQKGLGIIKPVEIVKIPLSIPKRAPQFIVCTLAPGGLPKEHGFAALFQM
ncbi:hypothetical protein D3C81_1886830 [compost metagenome]